MTENGAYLKDPENVNKHQDWATTDGIIGTYINEECGRTLQSYQTQPNYVTEHANQEEDTARGGYADRQLFELVQNGADALSKQSGRIEIRLTGTHLYCADSGEEIDTEGIRALMFSYLSPKRGTDEIGRFGLGFKSVLGVTDSPEFFSRSGSFRFDRESAKQMIQRQTPKQVFERYPVLRLAMPIDPQASADEDPILRSTMSWANNIVRLPLKCGALTRLTDQAQNFPPEFLLFVRHVAELDIKIDGLGICRTITLSEEDGEYHLNDGASCSRWKVFHGTHQLSGEARADSRALDDATEVPIWWTAPLEGANTAGHFWAFFPTSTPSLIPGIINAPWKTNEDRQNLLTGPYNDELVKAVANLIADNLHHLSMPEDPAKHLDALPRRVRQVDQGHTVALSDTLFRLLYRRAILPDIKGILRRFDELKYPPAEIVAPRRTGSSRSEPAISSWYSANRLNDGWLHQSATASQRWTFVERLCDPNGTLATDLGGAGTPVSTVAQWLEALVNDAPKDHLIYASKSAIRTAALIPEQVRNSHHLGSIVLIAGGTLESLNADIYLPSNAFDGDFPSLVHNVLARDSDTRQDLLDLGVQEVSPEAQFESVVKRCIPRYASASHEGSDNQWEVFWNLSRGIEVDTAASKIHDRLVWRSYLCLKTVDGTWNPIHSVFLPGSIVPEDGSRDDGIAVDIDFHRQDMELISNLGISDKPLANWALNFEPDYCDYLFTCAYEFQDHVQQNTDTRPHLNKIDFAGTDGVGPVHVFSLLSAEGKAKLTEALISEKRTFEPWEVRHETQGLYGSIFVDQPAIKALRENGRIQTSAGIVPFTHALGENPKSREAQRWLLDHPNAELIQEAFDLPATPQQQLIYAINAAPPVRITEAWPGLSQHLEKEHRGCNIIHCEAIHDEYGDDLGQRHIKDGDDIIVVYMDREDELDAIIDELNVLLDHHERFGILNQPTPEEIQAAREAVKEQPDAESKLLQAVGEEELLEGLPNALTAYYSRNGRRFAGKEVARAAISTYHTNALKEYRHALTHLDPPKQWAGSHPAIQFVTSLGFLPEWAGERSVRRDPFLEVPGPIELPPLHGYQRIVVEKLRQMLYSSDGIFGERRAMISLPTGSGKTRVAVEGIINSITEDGFSGGVMWVADRDELCEQAVQAWQEIWRAMGPQDQILRISRMWQGQPPPMATADRHVVVASVQTLASKFSRENLEYDFLRDFRLIVFDEAHRSIAPTFTSVMEELGFRVRRGQKEPLLLGLTATPYRGYSETETRWLANRYGQNRLDRGAFFSDDADKVMRELQEMQILARATHMEIEGSEFALSEQERVQAMKTPWLSSNTEIRLARDAERTERIISAYKEQIANQTETWPTLIFATSVEHAQTLAAILSADGISARAVSGNTDRYTRRQVVEQFRSGDLNVLVNYGVFREGFDAPKTRAIIVARPVYSPNLYFQMIGRGLRGIKNGGNDRCLILDVNDNIINFERNLAFTELDWLWD